MDSYKNYASIYQCNQYSLSKLFADEVLRVVKDTRRLTGDYFFPYSILLEARFFKKEQDVLVPTSDINC